MLKKILKSYDFSLIAVMIVLSIFGLVMVYSASMAFAVQRYHVAPDHFFQKQKMFLIVAAGIFAFFAGFPYKIMKSTKMLVPMVILSLLGLGGIFVFGKVAGNAQSWYEIGGISIQPSEFAKLAVIIYLSAVYAKKQNYINEFNRGVVPPLIYLILISGLILLQPDFGTAGLILLIAVSIILSSGMNGKNIFKLIAMGGIAGGIISFFLQEKIFSEVRMSRFTVLEDPFRDVLNEGFHLSNSLLAIGSGGITGLGLGKGVQKLGYLPESHTDFIIAVIAEELGLIGVAFVIICLGFIVLRGIHIGLKCKDPFGSLLALGISSMIGIQSIVNLAGVSGVIPLTGVPLPFVSYGGSSLIQLAVAAGILVNVSMFANYEQNYKTKKAESPPATLAREPIRARR
ncbi:FtsW/RodA/SpoVE family cell cycle protein [Neobacillus notoginsengisoli]|uniref:Probable peptidoglycan glycosyltransferase FtsW n=1 Tax=Neobacillus notoginsengisoli TaxID=1578198 RepID=A0A417YR04_9BACI|nr:FtsW/RodA/SpoVE family cell cycle protein [Neobacillus notoginsengisoli]RHW36542.1 FtsW/RodA/SpoVE family cell cycle protein [Neobacillus notoginsengisoli]